MKWSHTLIVDFLPWGNYTLFDTGSFCVSMDLPPSLLCNNASRNAISSYWCMDTTRWYQNSWTSHSSIWDHIHPSRPAIESLSAGGYNKRSSLPSTYHHPPNYIWVIVLAAGLPFSIITGLAGEYIIGDSDFTRCWYHNPISRTVYNSSIFTISFMSVDRFIFIYKPLRYEKLITVPQTLGASDCSLDDQFHSPYDTSPFSEGNILSTGSLMCTLYALNSPYYYSVLFCGIFASSSCVY